MKVYYKNIFDRIQEIVTKAEKDGRVISKVEITPDDLTPGNSLMEEASQSQHHKHITSHDTLNDLMARQKITILNFYNIKVHFLSPLV